MRLVEVKKLSDSNDDGGLCVAKACEAYASRPFLNIGNRVWNSIRFHESGLGLLLTQLTLA